MTLNRAARRAQERAAAREQSKALSGASAAVAWVQAHPIDAAKKISELENAIRANYGLIQAMVTRLGGEIVLERAEWQAPDPNTRLVIDPDASSNVTIRVEPK